MKVQHKALGIDFELPEILQKDLEAFEHEIEEVTKGIERFQISIYSGGVVRAAAKLGWLDGVNPEEVDTMKPSAVSFIANAVSEHIRDAKEVPPEA